MKREYGEEKHHHPSSNTAMLPNLPHQSHKFHLHSPPHLRHSATTSDEIDSHTQSPSKRNPNPNPNPNENDSSFPPPPPPPQPTSDGATIEVVRRPRGRPPGSKNKPRPPVIITRDTSEPSMSPYVLELPAGVDVVESTTRFCRKKNIGLCVLNGNGVVANVTLKQPSSTPGATVTFHGRFDILSLSATILLPGAPAGSGPFTISLAGPQGQVVGGIVVGPLVSAGTIYLIAATFNNPSFDRLQLAADHEDRDGGHESPQAVSGGGSGGAPIYSYQTSDVIWAPSARQPQPPQQPAPY